MHNTTLTKQSFWLAPLVLAPLMLSVTVGTAQARGGANPCSPTTYGAVGDGTTDNTSAIQKAINACATAGGGVVPLSGNGAVFMTGPIQLQSHILLQVNAGVTLRSVADRTRFSYAFVGDTFNQNVVAGSGTSEALITAYNVTDVGIIGSGTIQGAGSEAGYWTDAVNTKTDISKYSSAANFTQLAAAIASSGTAGAGPYQTYAGYGAIPTSNGLPRPWLVEFYGASHVTVSGITLTDSPMWQMGIRYCTDVTVTNYTVINPSTSPNTDGIDLVASNGVVLSNLNISTGDDNIAMKSGFPGFNTPAVPLQNVTITNSFLGTGHGMSIGSEADNGVQHLRVNSITWNGTDYGLRIKSGRDRGSDLSDMVLQNLTMTNVASPIFYTDYYTGQPKAGTDPGTTPVTATTPFVHDITVSNLTATGATSTEIVGLPEAPMRNIVLNNVNITANGIKGPGSTPNGVGLELRNVIGTFTNVTVTASKGANFVLDEHVNITNTTGSNYVTP